MNNKFYIKPSGIPLVDKVWGGFYIGGTYFLVGPRGSGKTTLGIQYARQCVRQKQVCLFFTSLNPKDMLKLANVIDFDIKAFMSQNLIILIKIELPELSNDFVKHDDELVMNWTEIVSVIEEYDVDKIIFDDFTPFIDFNRPSPLKDAFHNLTGTLEEKFMTSLFILSEPANEFAEDMVNTVLEEGNGVININNGEQEKGREMTIAPIAGHPEGQVKSGYIIKPFGGISVDYNDLSLVQEVAKARIKMEDSDGDEFEGDGRRNVFNEGFGSGTDDDFSLNGPDNAEI